MAVVNVYDGGPGVDRHAPVRGGGDCAVHAVCESTGRAARQQKLRRGRRTQVPIFAGWKALKPGQRCLARSVIEFAVPRNCTRAQVRLADRISGVRVSVGQRAGALHRKRWLAPWSG